MKNKRTEEFLTALLGLTRYNVYCDSSETFQGMERSADGDYIDKDDLDALITKCRKDMSEPETFQDLMSLLPGSTMGEEGNGSLVIYTHRFESSDGTVEFVDPENYED